MIDMHGHVAMSSALVLKLSCILHTKCRIKSMQVIALSGLQACGACTLMHVCIDHVRLQTPLQTQFLCTVTNALQLKLSLSSLQFL